MTTLEIKGKVLHGQHFGRTLGYPTANLDRRSFSRRQLKVRLGVYAGTAKLGAKNFLAAIVIGPKDKRELPKLEAYLIGFRGNLYGKSLTLQLKKFLRPYGKFANLNQLKQQIAKDIKRINLISKFLEQLE